MKKFNLTNFIKEQIISILNEDDGELNTDHVISAFKKNNVSNDIKQLLFRAYKEGDISAETVIKIVSGGVDEATIETSPEDLNKIKDKVDDDDTIRIVNEDEDEDEDHKSAEKGARINHPKSKKLDNVIKALNDTKKEMKTLVNQYKKAEGEDKQKYVQQLKVKTKIKSELESLVQKLEKDVV